MSSTDNSEAEAADTWCCASCGIAEVDEIKLKECDGCDLVKYCSDECQEDHRPQHEAKCKELVAKLRDKILFKLPESSFLGDCPICSLPISIEPKQASLQSCCSKWICNGCQYANDLRQKRGNIQHTCPFCRHPLPKSEEEAHTNLMKRVAANDPLAMMYLGNYLCRSGDYEGAIKYFTKAGDLGDVGAHRHLAFMYGTGEGAEKNDKKQIYHLEEAAIGGHPEARYEIGCVEWENSKYERAMKHFYIAARLGHDRSIQTLADCYKAGGINKNFFAAALRAHHAAVEATKSPQREAAAKYYVVHPLRMARKGKDMC